ncbi:MAG: flagellar type III secretion system pore protein FliP [Candidatus Gastranaerophilales bacterium]|nr:flagellar type III secretion system pore protein FliP [Candidatus Gastranaerophilales bacterium]
MDAMIKDLNPIIQMLILMTIFSLLPFVFSCLTSFLRFIIVFSILKTALGTQQVPPGIIIIGLSMVMTLYTMAPVFTKMYEAGYTPYQKTQNILVAIQEGSEPLKEFMMKQTTQQDLAFFIELRKQTPPKTPKDVSILDVAPAFMVSELKKSFEIGFVIFVPFVILDLVVANILLALGMMMLSPTIVSLPFKLLIFIAVDGWGMIVNGLINSFN